MERRKEEGGRGDLIKTISSPVLAACAGCFCSSLCVVQHCV
jgi:hypothetical protein